MPPAPPPPYEYRDVEPSDAAFLTEMLRLAIGWRIVPTADGAAAPVALAPRALDGLGRAGDGGVVATHQDEPAGACWYRLVPGGACDDGGAPIPQLTLAVAPQHRAFGVGGALLDGCIERARRAGHAAIDLIVEADNPARAMYERRGFEDVAVAGSPGLMRKRLRTPSPAPADRPGPPPAGEAGRRSSRASSR